MASAKEEFVEQAKRYDEMVDFMEKVSIAVEGEELSVEERNLLSVAYKNVIDARRASWRIISSIEQKEESRGNEEHAAVICDYQSKIKLKLSNICNGIFKNQGYMEDVPYVCVWIQIESEKLFAS